MADLLQDVRFFCVYLIKLIFIGILYIKNTNETASIVVVFEAIQLKHL
jgi:hypothetical protein